MTAPAKTETSPLAKMREPFAAHHISKLPKPTKAQTDAVRANYKEGIRCKLCGAWHHPEVVHLDYVGHAALTDRLLDADPNWNWEPQARDGDGLPMFDKGGGLWINLTVGGVTRPGYGNAERKNLDTTGGDRVKEVIGDALRNAAMRFGAALDLWHKGELHPADDGGEGEKPADDAPGMPAEAWAKIVQLIQATKSETGWLLKHYEVADLRALTPDQYDDAVANLETKLAEMDKAKSNKSLAEELDDDIGF